MLEMDALRLEIACEPLREKRGRPHDRRQYRRQSSCTVVRAVDDRVVLVFFQFTL